MTETSYTAWDDKLYQWPPPDGWYQAGDGKWWPEGYGPQPDAEPSPTADTTGDPAVDGVADQVVDDGPGPADGMVADDADHFGANAQPVTADEPAEQGVSGGFSSGTGPWSEFVGQNGRAAADAVGDAAGNAFGQVSTAVDTDRFADAAPDSMADVADGADRLADAAPDSMADVADGADRLADAASDSMADVADRFADAGPDSMADGAGALAEGTEGVDDGSADGGWDHGDAPGERIEERTGLDPAGSSDLAGLVGSTGGLPVSETSEFPSGFAAQYADSMSDATQVIPSDLPPPSDRGPAGIPTIVPAVEDDDPAPSTDADSPFGAPPPGAAPSLGAAPSSDAPVEPLPAPAGPNPLDLPPPSAFDAASFDAPPPGLNPPPPAADATAFDAPPPVGQLPAFDAPAPDLGGPTDRGGDDVGSDPGPPSALGARPTGVPPSSFDSPGPFDLPAPDGGAASPFDAEIEGLSGTDLDALPPPRLSDAASFVTDPGGDVAAAAPNGAQPTGDGGAAPPAGAGPDRFGGADGFDLPANPVPDVQVPSADSASASPFTPPPPGFDPAEAQSTDTFDPLGGAPSVGAEPSADQTMVTPMAGLPEPGVTGGFSPPPVDRHGLAGSPEQTPWGETAPGFTVPAPGPDQMDPAGPWSQQPYDQPGPYGQIGTESELQAGGSSRTIMLVVVGVLAMVAVGAALYFLFGGGGTDESDREGSFDAPHARGSGVEVSYVANETDRLWIIEILEPARDASSEGSTVPEDDAAFAATRVRVSNQATEFSAPLAELRFNAVTADGEVIDREANSCVVSADGFDFAAALPPGGSTEGTMCWQVPSDAVNGLLLGVESTEVGGRVHIQMQ